ncbi:MAG: hypothetical protein QOD36_196 [Mycobacterium sp.]|nr:hypothetical protein [Mycobacterium sp.]
MSSPERVCRAHRFLLKAASETVDRAGSRDQAMRIGVTPNVGRSVAEHNIPSISSWPTYPSINVWVMRNALCPTLIRGQYIVTKTARQTVSKSRSCRSVVEDVPRRSMCLIPSASARRSCAER